MIRYFNLPKDKYAIKGDFLTLTSCFKGIYRVDKEGSLWWYPSAERKHNYKKEWILQRKNFAMDSKLVKYFDKYSMTDEEVEVYFMLQELTK